MSGTPSSSASSSPSQIPPPPSPLPPVTGNWFTDIYNSATNVTSVPCARSSLLGGIASGLGIGVVRGLSTGALVAGHWAMATFVVVSLGSFQFCQRQMEKERQKVTRIIENMPRRVVKSEAEETSTPELTATKSNGSK